MYTIKKGIENHLCLIFDTFFIYYNTLFFIHDLEHTVFPYFGISSSFTFRLL